MLELGRNFALGSTIYTLRTRNFDRIPKVGPESVSRHPRSTGMVVGSASTVRSYSPDNMNESCVPRLGGGGLDG